MSETKHLELFLENSCFISYTFLKIVIHDETECILIEIVSNTISLYLNNMTIVIRIQIILSLQLVINQNKEICFVTTSPNITERVTAFPLQPETKETYHISSWHWVVLLLNGWFHEPTNCTDVRK